MTWRLLVLVVAGLLVGAAQLDAQTVAPAPGPPGGDPGLLTRFAFHLDAQAIGSDERAFAWDADIGGDLDLVDYGRGRLTFLANYEAILGEELRRFDPNQGNYTLDLSASARVGRGELALVFHHVSRHLSDRSKRMPIDWNMAGLRYMRVGAAGAGRVTLIAHALWTLRRSFVDYASEVGGRAAVRYPVGRRAALIAATELYRFGTDRELLERQAQIGARLEGGVRISGRQAAVELFGGFERRVDATPLRLGIRHWAIVGFRLVTAD